MTTETPPIFYIDQYNAKTVNMGGEGNEIPDYHLNTLLNCIQGEILVEDVGFTPNPRSTYSGIKELGYRGDGFYSVPHGLWIDIATKLLECPPIENGEVILEIDPKLLVENRIDDQGIKEWIDTIAPVDAEGNPLTLRPYQYEVVKLIHNYRRYVMQSVTSSGKTLMSILCTLYMIEKMGVSKVLIILPSIMLMDQFMGDVEEHLAHRPDLIALFKIISSPKLLVDEMGQVTIVNWQRIAKQPKGWYEQFEGLIVDEVHGAKAQTLYGQANRCVNAHIRLGTTATLDPHPINHKTVQGIFGAVHTITNYEIMTENKWATPVVINMVYVLHKGAGFKKTYKDVANMVSLRGGEDYKPNRYYIATEYLVECKERLELMITLLGRLKGNALCLYQRMDKHLIPNKELFDKRLTKPLFTILSTDNRKERAHVRKLMATAVNSVLMGTLKLLATGMSIKNLDHLFIMQGTKSYILILQMVGRLMRLHEGKDMAYVHDIVDGIPDNDVFVEHALERLKVYAQQEFEVRLSTEIIIPEKTIEERGENLWL